MRVVAPFAVVTYALASPGAIDSAGARHSVEADKGLLASERNVQTMALVP